MIEKELGKEYSLEEREQFLSNTCDGTEEVSYSRVFTPEELAKQRELLTDASIKLADIDEAKKEAMAEFKEQAKPYAEQRFPAREGLIAQLQSDLSEKDRAALLQRRQNVQRGMRIALAQILRAQ